MRKGCCKGGSCESDDTSQEPVLKQNQRAVAGWCLPSHGSSDLKVNANSGLGAEKNQGARL